MGSEIVYCAQCQNRLRAPDFDSGKALWSSDKPYCVDCVMGLVATLPPAEEQRILQHLAAKRAGPGNTAAGDPPRHPPPRKTSTSRIPVVKTERKVAPQSDAGIHPAIVWGTAGGIVMLLVALSVGGLGGRRTVPERREDPSPSRRLVDLPPPPPSPTPPEATTVPADPLHVRREEPARRALEKAREYGKVHPTDLPGRIALLEEAAWECRGTALAVEARKEHEFLQKERGDLLAAQLAIGAAAADGAAANARYGEAIALLQKERSRLTGADWSSAVDQKILQIRQRAEQSFAVSREKALQARQRGAEEEVRTIVAAVDAWGLADLATYLHAALAATPPPPPSLSPEARQYLASWERAFTLARARDYAAAVQVLDAAAKALMTAAMRADAAIDLDLLRLLSAAHADVHQAIVKWPKGQKLSVDVEGSAVAAVRVEGIVTRATSSGVEVRTDAGSFFIDINDLTAGSLRELLGKLPGRKVESDARTGALFLLLDGDLSAATGLPPRILEFGARVAQELARPDVVAQEADARARFDSAERDFADPASKLESFERYRALLHSYGETAFVRRRRAIIAQRLESEKEAGKEYVFFADQMRGSGAFIRTSHLKAAVCWASSTDAPQEKDNYVEFTFAVRPSTEYRAWVYVGACCAETFTFSMQATELASAEPGAAQGVAVKHAISFLKKTHALHGGRKEPSRFEWIALPLPKFASGGTKTIRLLSGQQGFTVAYAILSASRTSPPGDAMIKDWERARPLPPASAPPDSGLVAWWTLDEGSGAIAADGSPSRLSGTLRNDPVWTSGKRRGALSFDGRDDFVEVPKSPRLYFTGSFTVSAWVNVAELPASQFGMYAISDYTADGNRCTFALRVMPSGAAQFFWQHEDSHTTHATSATRLAPGTWVHLTGVWDGTVRTIYVNGIADGSNNASQPRPDVRGGLSIGRPGSFNGLYFRGRIDDVRLYDRALSGAEVQRLAR